MKRIILIATLCVFISLQLTAQVLAPKGIKVGPDKDATIAILTKIKTLGTNKVGLYSGNNLLTVVSPDTVPAKGNVVLVADSVNPTATSYATRYDLENEATSSELYKSYKESGANISPLEPMYPSVNVGGVSLVDGRLYLYRFKTKVKTTITGFNLILSTAGSYTGDGYNGIMIFRYSNDSIYKIAETPNSATFWQITANTVTPKALTTPVVLNPGCYAVAPIYNNSAQTTAPAIEATYCTSLAKIFSFTGGWHISSYINSVSTPATSYKYSGSVSGETIVPHIIYPY